MGWKEDVRLVKSYSDITVSTEGMEALNRLARECERKEELLKSTEDAVSRHLNHVDQLEYRVKALHSMCDRLPDGFTTKELRQALHLFLRTHDDGEVGEKHLVALLMTLEKMMGLT